MNTKTFERQPTFPRGALSRVTLRHLATDFVRGIYAFAGQRGLPVNRNELLIETARHVQRLSDLSDAAAQIVAGKAIGEFESWGKGVSFIVDQSEPHTVFLRDSRTGRTHVVTAVELAKLLAGHDGNLV